MVIRGRRGEQPPYWEEPKTEEDRKNKSLPRAVRNCNPGNIRIKDKWQGRLPENKRNDASFVEFVSFAYGYRALIKNIQTYIRRDKVDTLSAIIHKWAPAYDGNNPEQYVNTVCELTGFGEGKRFQANDKEGLMALAYAIGRVEAGQRFVGTFEDVEQGWNMI